MMKAAGGSEDAASPRISMGVAVSGTNGWTAKIPMAARDAAPRTMESWDGSRRNRKAAANDRAAMTYPAVAAAVTIAMPPVSVQAEGNLPAATTKIALMVLPATSSKRTCWAFFAPVGQ